MIDKYCVYIYSLHYVQREYIYHTTNRREEGNQTLRRSLPAERIRGCFAPPLLLAPVCSRGWNRTTTQAHTRCHKPSVKGRRSSYCRVHTDAMPPSLVSLPCRREVGIRTQLPSAFYHTDVRTDCAPLKLRTQLESFGLSHA